MNTNSNIEKLKEGFTHGGVFHADDVFATALLRIINPDIKISRGFAVPNDFNGIIYDIGGGRFDHHQRDSKVRENGVPYAAFGLLWEQFGIELLCEEDAKRFDEEFIQPIDRADNTGEENMLSLTISDRNLTWQDDLQQADKAFWKAVSFAEEILEHRFRQIRANRTAYELVREKAGQCEEGILYLEQAMPWKDAVRETGIFYVIYPAVRGGYNIQAVPSDEDKKLLKRPFPIQWRGASAEELLKLTRLKDLTFCHLSGFLCAAETLESAYGAARLSMQC